MIVMSMKGLELPMNVIVAVAIAVLVLVVMAAFFSGGFIAPGQTITATDAWSRGCAMSMARGCQESDFNSFAQGGLVISGFDPDHDDDINTPCTDPSATASKCDDNTLFSACKIALGYPSQDQCRSKCCGGGIATTTTVAST